MSKVHDNKKTSRSSNTEPDLSTKVNWTTSQHASHSSDWHNNLRKKNTLSKENFVCHWKYIDLLEGIPSNCQRIGKLYSSSISMNCSPRPKPLIEHKFNQIIILKLAQSPKRNNKTNDNALRFNQLILHKIISLEPWEGIFKVFHLFPLLL